MHILFVVQQWFESKLEEERGAGLAEYALLLALIAVVAIPALLALGGAINGAYEAIRAGIAGP